MSAYEVAFAVMLLSGAVQIALPWPRRTRSGWIAGVVSALLLLGSILFMCGIRYAAQR